ncbi:MAG: hypothetical protein N2489_10725 [Clostridia bacterium]|nr:hypothetical protein [Clostridia bacterium]
MKKDGNSLSKKLSLSGILLALTVITLFVESIAPTNRLSLYALSSFFIAVVIIEAGVKAAWSFYFASCILSFIIVQSKIELIPYAVFFGVYGIIKLYIEKINNIVIEYLLKLLFFNLVAILSFLMLKELILPGFRLPLPWWIVLLAAEAAFIVYDYVYSLAIGFYLNRLKKILKI